MSLVGFPPKNPFDRSGVFLSWQIGTILTERRDLVVFAGPILPWTVTKDWAQNSRNFTLQSRADIRADKGWNIYPPCFNQSFGVSLLLACGKHSGSRISLPQSGLREKRGYSLTRQRVIFLNRSVIK